MIREERFTLSHRPYAVDLASLRCHETTRRAEADAVWFRGRRGVTVACIGVLWDYQRTAPGTTVEFLYAHDDGRYGGDCKGRWDGVRYWGAQEPDVAAAHLEILRPMLAGYPACPEPFTGWWCFR
jgi:hypothetical protein